jgi:hypothetical protein
MTGIGKEGLTRRGNHAAILPEQDISALDEGIGQRHAEPPGKMVVAGAGETQRLVTAPARPIAGRRSLPRQPP